MVRKQNSFSQLQFVLSLQMLQVLVRRYVVDELPLRQQRFAVLLKGLPWRLIPAVKLVSNLDIWLSVPFISWFNLLIFFYRIFFTVITDQMVLEWENLGVVSIFITLQRVWVTCQWSFYAFRRIDGRFRDFFLLLNYFRWAVAYNLFVLVNNITYAVVTLLKNIPEVEAPVTLSLLFEATVPIL